MCGCGYKGLKNKTKQRNYNNNDENQNILFSMPLICMYIYKNISEQLNILSLLACLVLLYY